MEKKLHINIDTENVVVPDMIIEEEDEEGNKTTLVDSKALAPEEEEEEPGEDEMTVDSENLAFPEFHFSEK